MLRKAPRVSPGFCFREGIRHIGPGEVVDLAQERSRRRAGVYTPGSELTSVTKSGVAEALQLYEATGNVVASAAARALLTPGALTPRAA
jgi:hypothetical protein